MFTENSFRCPYCGVYMPLTYDTKQTKTVSFRSLRYPSAPHDESAYNLQFYKCPACDKVSVFAVGAGENTENDFVFISPRSTARQFPEYIPQAIRNDYQEACAIVSLSPKASATLSRRCLQGMIRDYWGVNENNLHKAIQAIQNKVTASQWAAIDALRRIGNIGAHMESDIDTIVDIDPGEAEKLIALIELLLDKWYIARHDEEELMKSITQINDEKQNLRHS